MNTTREDAPLAVSDDGAKSPARRQFFALATAVGGVALAGALYKPAQADIVASLGKIFYLDPTVLNFAFAIEELEADFFARSFRTKGYQSLSGAERAAFSIFANQDESHRSLLESLRLPFNAKNAGTFETLNTSSSRAPRQFYYPPVDTREDLLKVALDIKENALFTYHGAVGLVKSKQLLSVAASIAGVEGRHVAILRDLMGLDPVPAPFEGAITAQVAGRKFAPYGLKGGAPQ